MTTSGHSSESSEVCGLVRVNGSEYPVRSAEAELFCGRLEVSLLCDRVDVTLKNLPVGNWVNFVSLQGLEISVSDCRVLESDMLALLSICDDLYDVTSLNIEAIAIDSDSQQATMKASLRGEWIETRDPAQEQVEIQFQVVTQYLPFCRRTLIQQQEPIDIRFANHYLEMLGEALLPANATRDSVLGHFGEPNNQGGGSHPEFGPIPTWIRYSRSDYCLRFEFDDKDKATNVIVMPAGTRN